MKVTVQQFIKAPTARVWEIITDIENAGKTITGIISIEILHRPTEGFVGLKWREKRMFFGKEAMETMWIRAEDPGHWYETQAESHGCLYVTRLELTAQDNGTLLTMQFTSQSVSLMAKLMSPIMRFVAGGLRKAMQQDLQDICNAAERP